jgi:hypothetical protein
MDLVSGVAVGPGGYRRAFDAEIDCVSDREIRVRGVLAEARFALEHVWRVRTPEYDVLEASARHLRDAAGALDPELAARYAAIRGLRIGRGLTKAIHASLGDLTGTREHLWMAIEMARVGQQVYQAPRDLERRLAPLVAGLEGPARQARLAWEKDRSYMPDLRNSCYTYRDASAELFALRPVRCTFGPEVTSPRPGAARAFWRRKRLEVRRLPGGAFECRNRMQDTIHDIEVEFELSLDGTIRGARSRGLRLPYSGICEDAQLRTAGLDGRRVDSQFVSLLADTVGGSMGCTHLFDLSVDCLRLFDFAAAAVER